MFFEILSVVCPNGGAVVFVPLFRRLTGDIAVHTYISVVIDVEAFPNSQRTAVFTLTYFKQFD
jgi:hypothetical protein